MSAFRKDPSPGQKAAFIGLVVIVAWLAAWACWRLWLVLPWIAGMVASFAAGVGVGLWLRDRRRKALAFEAGFLNETVEAHNLATAAADHHHLNTGEVPLFGVAPQAAVALFDGAIEAPDVYALPEDALRRHGIDPGDAR